MKRFTAYLFWLQNAFHLHLLMQDQSSSAMQQPLGGVFSLTCEYHVRSTVCVSLPLCAVPLRWRSKDRFCGFCTRSTSSSHPAADQGIQPVACCTYSLLSLYIALKIIKTRLSLLYWFFFVSKLAMKGPPGPLGLRGRPGPLVSASLIIYVNSGSPEDFKSYFSHSTWQMKHLQDIGSNLRKFADL